MSQPVPTEPPQQTPPPGSGIDAVAGVTAGAGAASLAPVAAAGLTAAQAGQITAQVVAAIGKFLTKRKRDDYVFVMGLLRTQYPEWTETQLSELAREEMTREAEFRRKVIARLQQDIPEALKLTDPQQRAARVQAILDREKRYLQMRQEAMASRAIAAAERRVVKAASPQGAYWKLSPNVKEHTLDCLAMGEKFWPWEVLNAFHPPTHPGCQCMLYTHQEAQERGLMGDELPDKQDAIARAKSIIEQYGKLQETVGIEEILNYAVELLEAPRRIPKGFKGGGRFASKNPLLNAIRHLVPHLHDPLTARRTGQGRWKQIEGRRVFVPEGRHFERSFNGRRYVSPIQSTRVYRDGKEVAPSKLDEPRGKLSVAAYAGNETAAAFHEDRLQQARLAAMNALRVHTDQVAPVQKGAPAHETQLALEHAGFRLVGSRRNKQEWRGPDGSRLFFSLDKQGRVRDTLWKVSTGVPQPGAVPDSAPDTRFEFARNLQDFAQRTAARHGHVASIGRVTFHPNREDHTGEHMWDGHIELADGIGESIDQAHAARQAGTAISPETAAGTYAAFRAGYHEALHAANPITPDEYHRQEGQALEEALTEEQAHVEARRALHEQGMDDVLAWAADNPVHYETVGIYGGYRNGLDELFNAAHIPPEDREELIEHLKLDVTPEDRWAALGELLHAADPNSFKTAKAGRNAAIGHMRRTGQDMPDVVPLTVGADMPLGSPTRFRVANGTVGVGSTVMFQRPRHGQETATVTRLMEPFADGTLVLGVQMENGEGRNILGKQVTAVLGEPQLHLFNEPINPGDTIDANGRHYQVNRVLAAHTIDNPDGWIVDATAGSNGRRVLLTGRRVQGQPKLAKRATGAGQGTAADIAPTPGDQEATQGNVGMAAVDRPGWALAFTRGHTARRAVLANVAGALASRAAHVEMLERNGWEVPAWEDGNLAGLHLGAQLVAAGATDQDLLKAALSRGPKDGGSDENVGFQSGMRSAALALQHGGHSDLSAYAAGPHDWTGRLPELGQEGHLFADWPYTVAGGGKASLGAGVPFDPGQLGMHKQLLIEDKKGKPWMVRKTQVFPSGGASSAETRFEKRPTGSGKWKLMPKDAKFDGWSVAPGSSSGPPAEPSQSKLPGFGDLWQPSKPKPFDPQRAKTGQRVRDMQGNDLMVTLIVKGEDGKVNRIHLTDEQGSMAIPVGSLPPLDLVPEGGKSWSKPKESKPVKSDDDVWEISGYAGKAGSGRWASGPDNSRAVVKDHGGDRDRVATEVLANGIYRALGVAVPDMTRTQVKGKDATVSAEIVGAKPDGFPVSSRELGAGFMADALLANWDVVGKDGHHVVWADGVPTRVDQSQALMYRGQAKKKPFGPVPTEVWSMNGPRNDAFFAMLTTPEDRKAQAQHIADTLTDELIDTQVNDAGFKDEKMADELKVNLKARRDWMRDYAAGKVEEPQPLAGQDARDEFRQSQEGLSLLPEQHAAMEAFLADPEVFADKGGRVFLPGEEGSPDEIGGPPLVAVEEPDWEKHEDVAVSAPSGPSFEEAAGKGGAQGLKQSAGVIVTEPDGRVWTFEPKGHFGGYERTLSKGRVDEGQTEQQAALRELWEETGLLGRITGDVGWYRGTTTMTHYFRAERTGGAPWAHDGHETAAVYLQAPEVAAAALQQRDVNALRDAGVASGHAAGLDSLLRHAKTREDATLYVSLPLVPGDDSLVGKTLRDKGYLDASTDMKVAARRGKAVVKLLAPAGSNLLYTRGVQSFEKAKGPEVIGQRGARLRVVGQRTEGGKVVLDAVLVP